MIPDELTTHENGWLDTWRDSRWAVASMVVICVVLVVLTGYRAYSNLAAPSSEFDWSNRGFSDFHNGTYFPTQAFMDGQVPYSHDVAQEYSMAREAPPYSPVVFLIHVPFALLPLEISRFVFFAYNVGLLALLAYCCLRMAGQQFRWFDFWLVLNCLLISRPGHQTLFTGYFTTEIILGCMIALHFPVRRPALSGLGLVLASIKPNFILPLIALMLFRRRFKAVLIGLVLCAVSAGVGVGWLASQQDLDSVIKDIRSGQEALYVDETEIPINTWTRLDITGVFAKLTDWNPGDAVYLGAMAVFLGLCGTLVLLRVPDSGQEGADTLVSLFICMAVLLSIYHHSYDCLLLAVPTTAMVLYGGDSYRGMAWPTRFVLGGLLLVPAFNYLSTKSAMEALSLEKLSPLWQGVTLVNGVCLLVALLIVSVQLAFQAKQEKSEH